MRADRIIYGDAFPEGVLDTVGARIAERFIDRKLSWQQVTETYYFDCNAVAARLQLDVLPVGEIERVECNNETVERTDYRLVIGDMLSLLFTIKPTDVITVIYTGGYTANSLPSDIGAAIKLINGAVDNATPNQQVTQAADIVHWQYEDIQRSLPLAAKTLLEPYRLLSV